jgi:hypothetical protein
MLVRDEGSLAAKIVTAAPSTRVKTNMKQNKLIIQRKQRYQEEFFFSVITGDNLDCGEQKVRT